MERRQCESIQSVGGSGVIVNRYYDHNAVRIYIKERLGSNGRHIWFRYSAMDKPSLTYKAMKCDPKITFQVVGHGGGFMKILPDPSFISMVNFSCVSVVSTDGEKLTDGDRTNAEVPGMKKWIAVLSFMTAVFCWSDGVVIADTSFRCGNTIIDKGDTMYTIRQECGEPVSEQRVGERTIYSISNRRQLKIKDEVYVVEWIYKKDAGIYILTFEGSRLIKKEYSK